MTTITWKGEPSGPPETTWRGIVFRKGEPVKVEDVGLLSEAGRSEWFTVGEDEPEAKPAPKHETKPEHHEPATKRGHVMPHRAKTVVVRKSKKRRR